jgi:hypothetical protein
MERLRERREPLWACPISWDPTVRRERAWEGEQPWQCLVHIKQFHIKQSSHGNVWCIGIDRPHPYSDSPMLPH